VDFWKTVEIVASPILGAAFFGIIAAIGIALFAEAVFKKDLVGEGGLGNNAFTKIYVCCGIVLFLFFGSMYWYGNHNIGSIFECLYYKDELYYAHLYADDDNLKNYKVIVELDRDGGVYYIDKVYFNKSQYITVDDPRSGYKVDELVGFTDTSGRQWYLELTKQRAKKIPERK